MKDLLKGKAGPAASVVVLLVGLACVWFFVLSGDGGSELRASANTRWYVDEGGVAFQRTLEPGQSLEVQHDGKRAWPAELCYWTKEGTKKEKPTPVLLNSWLGKPEPTFCPDCNRLVVPLNPSAAEKAPPTKDEYSKKRE